MLAIRPVTVIALDFYNVFCNSRYLVRCTETDDISHSWVSFRFAMVHTHAAANR